MLLGTAALLGTLHAQDTKGRARYLAEVGGMRSLAREKALSEALNDWDPTSINHIQPNEGTVEILVLRSLDRSELAAWMAVNGFTLTSLKRWNAATDRLEDVKENDPDAYPAYIDTGDPFNDNKAYDHAKAHWLEVHGTQSREERAMDQEPAQR